MSDAEDYTERRRWWALEGKAGLYTEEGVLALFATKEEADRMAEGGDVSVEILAVHQRDADRIKKLRKELSKSVNAHMKLADEVTALAARVAELETHATVRGMPSE